MARMHEKYEILGEECLDMDLRFLDREVDDGSVELSRDQAGDQAGSPSLGNDRPHIGVIHVQSGEELGHEPAPRGSDDPKASFTGNHIVKGRQIGGDLAQFTQDPAPSLDDNHTFLGEFTRRSIDESRPNLSFEA